MRSQFISAHIIITTGQRKISMVNFICLVAILYCNTYTAELYGTLAIIKLVQYITLKSTYQSPPT